MIWNLNPDTGYSTEDMPINPKLWVAWLFGDTNRTIMSHTGETKEEVIIACAEEMHRYQIEHIEEMTKGGEDEETLRDFQGWADELRAVIDEKKYDDLIELLEDHWEHSMLLLYCIEQEVMTMGLSDMAPINLKTRESFKVTQETSKHNVESERGW